MHWGERGVSSAHLSEARIRSEFYNRTQAHEPIAIDRPDGKLVVQEAREPGWGEADTGTERALAVSEKAFGHESVEVAQVLASLGNTRSSDGDFEGALSCLKRSLEIREKALAPTNTELVISFHNLGNLYSKWGDYARALPYLERSAELLEK